MIAGESERTTANLISSKILCDGPLADSVDFPYAPFKPFHIFSERHNVFFESLGIHSSNHFRFENCAKVFLDV